MCLRYFLFIVSTKDVIMLLILPSRALFHTVNIGQFHLETGLCEIKL